MLAAFGASTDAAIEAAFRTTALNYSKRKIILKTLRSVVAIALLTFGTLSAQTSRHVAVHAGHLLDVKSGKLLSDQMLLIEDGKIVSSGAAAEAKVPADALRIDLPTPT